VHKKKVWRYVKSFLFPQYKFLKIGWEEYRPDIKDSLSSVMEEDKEDTAAEKQERNVGESISAYYPVEVQQHEMQPKQCDQDGIQK
jgi:hypothetical protein